MSTMRQVSPTLGYSHPIRFALAIKRATGYRIARSVPDRVQGPEQEIEPLFLDTLLDFLNPLDVT